MTTAVGVAFLPPEVLQLGGADCGPAALASALRGMGSSVPTSELRRLLGSDAEGTGIGDLERVATELGLAAEQVMVPVEAVLDGSSPLPAIAVVALPDGRTHYVLLWRKVAGWIIVMDPASGVGLWSRGELDRRLFVHDHPVPASLWREWAATQENLSSLARRLRAIGLSRDAVDERIRIALADPSPGGLAVLDAVARLAASLVAAGALRRREVGERLPALCEEVAGAADPTTVLAERWWSALPTGSGTVRLRGALLLRFGDVAPGHDPTRGDGDEPVPKRRFRDAHGVAAAAGVSGLLVAAEGFGLAALASGVEGGRLVAAAALIAVALVVVVSGGLEGCALARAFRAGRRDELALRLELAERLPRIPDQAVASRAHADLADRVHAAVAVRHGPHAFGGVIRAGAELAAIVVGLLVLAPAAALPAAIGAILALALPMAARRSLASVEVSWREAGARLATLSVDAARGHAAARDQGLGAALRAEHEMALERWTQSALRRVRFRGTWQGAIAIGGAAAALAALASSEASALLVVGWWALRIPDLGAELVSCAADRAGVETVGRRLAELTEVELEPRADQSVTTTEAGPHLELAGVSVRLGGVEALRSIDLEIPAGSEVALVGPSGAGKSTLVRLLLGLHTESAGVVLVDGAPRVNPAQLRHNCGWIDGASALPEAPVGELVLGAGCPSCRRDETRPQTSASPFEERLTFADLEGLSGECLARLPSELPSEVLRKVRLAFGAGPSGARFLALDEPYRGIPQEERRSLHAALRARAPRATVIHATHDLDAALEADLVAVIAGGEILELGPPEVLASQGGAFATALAATHPFARWPGLETRTARSPT